MEHNSVCVCVYVKRGLNKKKIPAYNILMHGRAVLAEAVVRQADALGQE